MRSWLPTRASTNVSLRVTLDRHRLVDLLTPVTAGVDEAVLHVTSDGLVARAADEAHVRSVTATLDADACSQYAVTPGRLALDPTALRAALPTRRPRPGRSRMRRTRSRSRTRRTTRRCR